MVVFLLIVLCGLVSSVPWDALDSYSFDDYVMEYGKRYVDDVAMRQRLFYQRRDEAIEHNAKDLSWKVTVNAFSDWTDEEKETMFGYDKHLGSKYVSRTSAAMASETSTIRRLPRAVDWRRHNVTTAVKSQGNCGSCWSFAAAETLESHLAIATGQLVVLSEEELVECMPNPHKCGGTGGCMGAVAQIAFDWVSKNGLQSEDAYPYTSGFGDVSQCKSTDNPLIRANGHHQVPTNSYNELMQAIAFHGPVSISVDASSWHSYAGGVFDGCDQENPDINHAVQLVGYGEDSQDGPYWIVRNSWGAQWGEDGHIRLRRTPDNLRCGTDTKPSDGNGCEGGPPTELVCGTCGILFDNSYPLDVHFVAQERVE